MIKSLLAALFALALSLTAFGQENTDTSVPPPAEPESADTLYNDPAGQTPPTAQTKTHKAEKKAKKAAKKEKKASKKEKKHANKSKKHKKGK